jgi:chromosome condensin MukBEF MukE localization factor
LTNQEQIIITVKEAKIAKKLLQRMDEKRKIYRESAWLYLFEAYRNFNSSAVRSFLEKLERKGIIEFMGTVEEIQQWGGVFRFTKNGEEKIREEIREIIDG